MKLIKSIKQIYRLISLYVVIVRLDRYLKYAPKEKQVKINKLKRKRQKIILSFGSD